MRSSFFFLASYFHRSDFRHVAHHIGAGCLTHTIPANSDNNLVFFRMLTDDDDEIQYIGTFGTPAAASSDITGQSTSANADSDDDVIDLIGYFEKTRLSDSTLNSVSKPVSLNEQSFPSEYQFLLTLDAINTLNLMKYPVNIRMWPTFNAQFRSCSTLSSINTRTSQISSRERLRLLPFSGLRTSSMHARPYFAELDLSL